MHYVANCRIGNKVNASRYSIDPKQANFDLAKRILDNDIPSWIERYAENGNASVDVVAKAYAEDPSRFVRAKDADSFDSYFVVCRG